MSSRNNTRHKTMDEEAGQTTTKSSWKTYLTSSAKNILHFLGIHSDTEDDDIWEYKTLHRIQVIFKSFIKICC
jgi:hypothetical protein